MNMSKTMMAAVEAIQKFGCLVVSEGFKTSPATLVPEEDEMLGVVEITQKYTEAEWTKRAFNRQTINKLVKEGVAKYDDSKQLRVSMVTDTGEPVGFITYPKNKPEPVEKEEEEETPVPLDDREQISLSDVRTEDSEPLSENPMERLKQLEGIVERMMMWTHILMCTANPDYDLGYGRAQQNMWNILQNRTFMGEPIEKGESEK